MRIIDLGRHQRARRADPAAKSTKEALYLPPTWLWAVISGHTRTLAFRERAF
jgi:hypothetical protein